MGTKGRSGKHEGIWFAVEPDGHGGRRYSESQTRALQAKIAAFWAEHREWEKTPEGKKAAKQLRAMERKWGVKQAV